MKWYLPPTRSPGTRKRQMKSPPAPTSQEPCQSGLPSGPTRKSVISPSSSTSWATNSTYTPSAPLEGLQVDSRARGAIALKPALTGSPGSAPIPWPA
jgi:hypothetical protein